MEWRGREWSGGEGRGGQGRVPDCLGGLSRVGISSRSTRPWNGQPPSYLLYRINSRCKLFLSTYTFIMFHCVANTHGATAQPIQSHSERAANWPRLSETETKWFVFETSLFEFGGRYCIESIASQK